MRSDRNPDSVVSTGVGADNAVGEREHHELGTGLELQLAHDERAVRVDGAGGDEEPLADLVVRVAERQKLHDVAFSFGQGLDAGELLSLTSLAPRLDSTYPPPSAASRIAVIS
jgi:hypothetical protein